MDSPEPRPLLDRLVVGFGRAQTCKQCCPFGLWFDLIALSQEVLLETQWTATVVGPSSNLRGIALALLLVEQSIAAPMKSTSSSCFASDAWRSGLARSWLSSNSQSTVRHRHPQNRKARVSGALGPDIKSAISGACCFSTPREVTPPSSLPHHVDLDVFLHAAAPCPEAPHTRSFLTTSPHLCCPKGHGGLFLHCPC